MKFKSSHSGQIIVEYMLLLLIAVVLATILVSKLVGKRGDRDNAGALIKSWDGIIQSIGNDLPDCPTQSDFKKPNCP